MTESTLALTAVLMAPPVLMAGEDPAVPPDHAERWARGLDLFAKRIGTLLAERCLECHGGGKTKADLDLSSRESLLKGGQEGPAIVPYQAAKSRLVKLVAHQLEPHMPYQKERLLAEDIARLAEWIDLGAPYAAPLIAKAGGGEKKPMVVTDEDRQFWSFQPLARAAPPAVKDEAWCRTPADRFLLAKLEAKGFTPAAAADRRILIRRAYFDLVGLPPPPEEVESFLADPAPDAYEKLIDRLLANPHFGERWARHWLDAVRFAESHGFEHDTDRPHAYHYRDFVIRAFNEDLPYDTFVKWQIAGDEYAPAPDARHPAAPAMALMATGFLAAGVHATQITANQVEKERYDELDDMTRTVGTAMLGLTVGCARCHDHKYDPIPTRDYYRMLSTFTATVRSEMDVDMDPEGHTRAMEAFARERQPLAAELKRCEEEEIPGRFEAWLGRTSGKPALPMWTILDLAAGKTSGGTTFDKLEDGSLLAGGKDADFDAYVFTARTRAQGITAVRLEALADPSLPGKGPGRAPNSNFALSGFRVAAAPLESSSPAVPVALGGVQASFEQKGFPAAAALDADPKSAWAVDPEFGKDHAAVFATAEDIGFPGGTLLTFTLEFQRAEKHGIGRPRIAVTAAPRPAGREGDSIPEAARDALASLAGAPPGALAPDSRRALLAWWKRRDPRWRDLHAALERHDEKAPRRKTSKVLISSEGVPAVRLHTQGGDFLAETHFLKRGDPNQKEGVATQSFLQVLLRAPGDEERWLAAPPAGSRTSYRRRALAEWLTDGERGAGHLLARVIVNRLWQHHMGRGIVATPGDFGFQGERPSHPELLDWLAEELLRSGWRLKPIHKLIMTSAAYRAGYGAGPDALAADPENALFSHRRARRLEAEVLRDAILAASGSLDETMFGPGTLDPASRRRSIYFTVKRSKMVPMMVLFDAPDALQGNDRRPATTIAPQGLLLMNGALSRECAEALARRAAPGPEIEPAVAVGTAYRIALGRQPSGDELRDATEFIREQAASYAPAEGAPRLSLTDFCQTLFCANEFLYID